MLWNHIFSENITFGVIVFKLLIKLFMKDILLSNKTLADASISTGFTSDVCIHERIHRIAAIDKIMSNRFQLECQLQRYYVTRVIKKNVENAFKIFNFPIYS